LDTEKGGSGSRRQCLWWGHTAERFLGKGLVLPPRVAGRRRHALVASTGPDIGTSSACHKSDGHRTHSRPRAASRSFSSPQMLIKRRNGSLARETEGFCPLQRTVQSTPNCPHRRFSVGGWAPEPLTAPCQGVADCFTAGPAPGRLPPRRSRTNPPRRGPRAQKTNSTRASWPGVCRLIAC
jgi:hypothetical protein